jgi:ABC-2 type transport system ATP-binding protein
VTAGPTGWLRDVKGVDVIEQREGTALLELATDEVADRLLAEALRRGPVREFAEIVPSVADVFREMTAA